MTVIDARRDVLVLLAAATYEIVFGPWPDVPEGRLSQAASAVAVHWHSRAVSTVTDPLPPVGAIVVVVAATVTAHRSAAPDGLTTVVDEDPRRDDFEIALIAAGRARRVPNLAIGRRVQVVYVASGGTLVQDIPAQQPGSLEHSLPITPHPTD